MSTAVQDVLNRYLSAELGRSLVLPNASELARQRAAFLARFGPEPLARMSGSELLRQLPHNASNDQPMDYWLEFKNDDEFNSKLFGSISGGAATKYGTWQDRESGSWRAPRQGARGVETITGDQALPVIENRRTEILAAVEAIRPFSGQSAGDIDAEKFQTAISSAAPRWFASAWLHKYLHLNYPELLTRNATQAYSEAQLYRVGEVPTGGGLFALDLQIIRFWNTVPALADLSAELRYRVGNGLGPRDHWCLGLTAQLSSLNEMLGGGYLALSPANVGNLTEVIALTRRRDIRPAVETAFHSAGLETDSIEARNLTEVAYRLKEGSIVALFSDAATVVAVGEVAGGYRFVPGAERPHQLPVRWYPGQNFRILNPVAVERGLTMLRPDHPAVAEIESSLLVSGVGPWPNFADTVKPLPPNQLVLGAAEIGAKVEPLPPLEGICRQVSEMLERKRQVILYGPPGTGKTYQAERIALELVARHNFRCSPERLVEQQRDAVYGRGTPDANDPYIATCTFHPMYAYEDFIEGYRPDGAGFKLEPGIFKRMVSAAQKQPDQRFVLIIDEINRGNIPKIFGELITLIEATKRGRSRVILPLSKEAFAVPDNLFVIGTMNTADRSILLLDTALRRRFAFKELLPEPHLLRTGGIAGVTLSTWLRALNRGIVEHLGRDGRNLQVGHAYLMPEGRPAATLARIGEIVRDELWPLLQEYCYEDPKKLANILAADRGGVFDRKSANLRFDLFEPGREDELAQALIAIVTPEDTTQDAALGEEVPDDENADNPQDAESVQP